MQKIVMLLLVSFCLFGKSFAQQHPKKELHLSFIKQSFYYPSTENFGGTFHPGIAGGIDFLRYEEEKKARYFTTELGFYHHEYFQNAVFLLGGFRFQRDLGERFSWYYQPKFGYMHTFSPTKEFKLEEGEYVVKNGGRPTLMAGISIGFNYELIESSQTNLMVSYQMLAEGPFATYWGVPVVPHNFLSIGIKTALK